VFTVKDTNFSQYLFSQLRQHFYPLIDPLLCHERKAEKPGGEDCAAETESLTLRGPQGGRHSPSQGIQTTLQYASRNSTLKGSAAIREHPKSFAFIT